MRDPHSTRSVTVVGAGLAGCEAAWQAAQRGARVVLYEMKPAHYSPAHRCPDFAELVCSNSLRSNLLASAVGLLKEEMRRLGSLLLEAADETAVPAGRALAVDRAQFSQQVTRAIETHPRIEVRHQRVERIPNEDRVVIATGPLTAPELAAELQELVGEESLYFYDAISPIVYADSIDHQVPFRASRYQEGEGDYLNLPLDGAAYRRFVAALLAGRTVPLHHFESARYFEGCLPIEEIARRGGETLAHGPMKPVGLVDPRTGRRPHAVVQLRQEDKRGILYNLVGFQTKLRIADQRKVFRTLPGMEKAVFARYGSVHRNTYVNAPKCLAPTLELRSRPGLYLAGQVTGVEGYVESAATGFVAGVNAAFAARGATPPLPSELTAHGALLRYLVDADPRSFQPMNLNFGLFPPLTGLSGRTSKAEKHRLIASRALAAIASYREHAAVAVQ
jgi:methylenetetrahydrofolate--tRNA-(uracil-5-)-methyltransferase